MSTDEDLAALHRRSSEPAHRGGCPTAAELFSLLDGSAAPAERERLVDHVAGCTACAEEVRLMRSLQPWSEEVARRLEAPHPLAPSPTPSPRPGEGEKKGTRVRGARRWLRPLPLAAALVAAVIGAGILLRQDAVAPPDSAVLRGAVAERVSPAPDAVLHQPPLELAWPAQTGATGYRPQLFDEEANLVWEGEVVREPKAEIPAAVRAGLRPGASYFWAVEVEGTSRRRQLGAFWFRLEEG